MLTSIAMSSQHLAKLAKYIPLWRRQVPRYPLYWKGNPQLRVFLPLFWVRLVKSQSKSMKGEVKLEVHPQMTKFDVKNYLEKIYNVPVLSVATDLIDGKDIIHDAGYKLGKEDPTRIAYVQLAENKTFDFPEIFKEKKTEEQKTADDYKKLLKGGQQEKRKNFHKMDIPVWFR